MRARELVGLERPQAVEHVSGRQYKREYGSNLSVWLLPETVAALRYRAGQDHVSVSELMRAGAALVLGYCPTCLRPLDHGGGDG